VNSAGGIDYQKAEFIKKYLKSMAHKIGVKPSDWDLVKPNLLLIADFVVDYATDHDLPILFTSIIRPRIKGVSKSVTHEEGRAFDLSVRGWNRVLIDKLVILTNDKFHIGAISITDGKEREAVYEDGITAGLGAHLHFQVRRG